MPPTASIRAYGAELSFKHEIVHRIDRYLRAGLTFYNLNRWIGIRADTLSAVLVGGIAFYLVYAPGYRTPSNIGFVLNMAGRHFASKSFSSAQIHILHSCI